MAALNPFKITIYDKTLARQGWVGNPNSCSFTPRHNAQGTGQLAVMATDPNLEFLLQEGARVGVEYRGEHLMSGPLWGAEGDVLDNGLVTFQVRDDWMLTANVALVNPGEAAAATSLTDVAQTSGPMGAPGTIDGRSGYYDWGTPASREEAVKGILVANLAGYYGLPVVAEPDGGRGGPAVDLPQVRMSTLSEAVTPLLEAGQLGLRIWQKTDATHLSVDVYETTDYPRRLTARSGIIKDGSWAMSPPAATRAIVGGPGDLAARAFAEVVDSDLEARYGTVIARFRDATGTTLDWGSTPEDLQHAIYYLLRPEVADPNKARFSADLIAAGLKTLTEGAPTSSLGVKLSETEGFRFMGADGVHLGDRMTIRTQGIDFTERITEATVALSSKGKLTVTPVVGQRKDDPTRQLAAAVAALAGAQRRAATSR